MLAPVNSTVRRTRERTKMTFWRIAGVVAVLVALVSVAARASAQHRPEMTLPAPTGSSIVGTTVWHWIDAGRLDTNTPELNDVREIMVQAWYPAARDSVAELAPYAPLYMGLSHVRVWSYAAARVAPTDQPLPVLVIAPGRGVARHFYTSIAEDLASHGYFVLAVDSPHSGRVVYPDGRFIPPSPRYRIPFEVLTGPYEHVDEFFDEAAKLGAADIAFALKRLTEINREDPARRFTGRIDLSRLGAFGHSLGGRIAGAAVANDPRFVAYASMEGVPPREPRKRGMDAAVLMIVSSSLPDMAQPNIRDIIPGRRNDAYVVTLEGFGHNSVTDLPVLDPEEYGYEVEPEFALDTTRRLLLAFFNQYVRGDSNAMSPVDSMESVRFEVFERE
jgi:predicted dienelactone hydrolase